MNEGLFNSQVNVIDKVLNHLGILLERNYFPNYHLCVANRFRNKPYKEVWEICFAEKFYNFLLQDYSLFQFRADFHSPVYNYCFYESPHRILAYTDYVQSEFNLSDEELQEIGDLLRYDYEGFLSSSEYKEDTTPVRYDYDPLRYLEARHPASHMHMGHNNNIRIRTKKLLKPLSFLEFVLRQYYPEKWIEFLNSDINFLLCRNVRDNLGDINNIYINPLDMWEMVLY